MRLAVAPGARVGDRRTRGRNRNEGTQGRVARWAALGLLVGGAGGRRRGLRRRRRRRRRRATAIEGLGTSLEEIQAKAREEGEVNIVQWAGYAQLTDEFTAATGCKVNTKDGAQLRRHDLAHRRRAQYDGVSASGNASVRLMATGDVAPVDTDLIPNYADVQEGSRTRTTTRLDGQPYGVPHGRGPNYLMFRTDDVPEDTDSWGVIWEDDRAREVQGQDLDLRRLDLHRGRRALPEGDAARPRDRQPVPAERGAVQRRGRPAEEAGAERRRVLAGRRTRSRSSRSRTATAWSGRRGRTSTSS